MTPTEHRDELHRYLQAGRDAVLWKLDGLSEYDVRRPLVPTGTNLLGLVKHLAGVEAGYFGEVFDRPFPEPLPWMATDAEPNADLWATADESREEVLALYRRVQEHADATIAELELDAPGRVPWWGEQGAGGDVTLGRILVHVATETHRHAGHTDIVRELIDGVAGLRAAATNLPDQDATAWSAHRDRLEAVARAGSGSSGVHHPPPRDHATRVRDTRHRLAHDVDAWVATADPELGPHLVPLSFLFDAEQLWFSTATASRTARNLPTGGRCRITLGHTRDVIHVAGHVVERVPATEVDAALGDRFAARTGFDPRDDADRYVYLAVRPDRLQAWREVEEFPGRDLVRDGTWLDPADG